jgi:hypothetical protein
MNRYQQGKVYAIRSHQTDKWYLGSTCLTLTKRLCYHKTSLLHYNSTGDKYCSAMEMFKHNDYYIELIENFPCQSKNELNKREGELIRIHKTSLVNIYIAGRTTQEYYQENKERITEIHKEWNENNKEKRKEDNKLWRETNKEKVQADMKKWREDNLEYCKQKDREYQQKNKVEIEAKRGAKYTCLCGVSSSIKHKARHEKSKKHQEFITNN